MTVVPADHLMTLICDDCGDTVTAAANVLPDAEVVWTLVFDNGWVGSPFASGPHHCPRCSIAAETGSGRSTTGLGIDYLDEVAAEPAPRDADPAEAVRRALAEAIDLGDRVLVDLSEVELVDPAGLGLLVRAHQEARHRSAALCLVAPTRFVLTVLHTMRLDDVFPVYESRAAALHELGHPASATAASVGPEPVTPSTVKEPPW
ncbi:STAS domain-containing protein [Micromonospora sp. DR5-3]|uniref:STAS domain-containing protein n=1 Tax=unclassified Micromonospora TaxID=2617518 RepID=UPI0011D8A06A|nr:MULTISPECIES: STAS domain-containing protein [unclassified Micromonospora]MCW3818168.1 STAS domain-containing protein [Micromonospora sp. DR5-3]TYC21358.1 STAS domain-containing protein [Micromonospora sp. MP36]